MTIKTSSQNKLLPPDSAELEFEEFRKMTSAELAKAASLHRSRSDQMLYLVVPSHDAGGVIESYRFQDLDGVIYSQVDGSAKVVKDRGGILKAFLEMPAEVAAVRRIREEQEHLADMLTEVEALRRMWADSSGLHKPSLLEKSNRKLSGNLALRHLHEGLLFILIAQSGTDAELRKIENRLTDRQGEIEAFLAGN